MGERRARFALADIFCLALQNLFADEERERDKEVREGGRGGRKEHIGNWKILNILACL